MRVLVTGATGFVGQGLIPALAQSGFQVRAATRSPRAPSANVEWVQQGDLASDIDWPNLLEGCNAVVHLAGIAHIGPSVPQALYDRVNHQATAALAFAAHAAGITRLIFASSIRAQSGPVAEGVLTESDPPQPTEAYGASKLAAEAAVRTSGVPYVILRPVMVYGPQARGNFAALMRVAALPIPLPFGSFLAQRSLVSRTALIDAILFALRSSVANETFIVADRSPISFRDMIAALRRGFGRSPGLVPVPLALMRRGMRVAGLHGILDRIDGEMVASPAKLVSAGWMGAADTHDALAQVAREMATPTTR